MSGDRNMHTSASVARAARVWIAAALVFGPSFGTAAGLDLHQPNDGAGGSAAVVGSAGGDAAAGDALAVTVDPRDAASADVVATLRSLHEVVGERMAADAEA